MPDLTNIYGWDGTQWVKILVNAAGKLIIDPSEILQDDPQDSEVGKAPTSNWAHDHKDLPDVHHVAFVAADHTAIGNGAPHHAEAHTLTSHSTKAHSELSGIGSSDHHVRYADSEAIAAAKTDPTLLNYTQGARAYHSASQTLTTSVWLNLAMDSERWDTDIIHDLVTNNSRLTCKTAGMYIITGHVEIQGNATGLRQIRIRLNGATAIAINTYSAVGTGDVCISIATIYQLAVNDYVELGAYQSSGGNLSLYADLNFSPEFAMQRIG